MYEKKKDIEEVQRKRKGNMERKGRESNKERNEET